MKTNIPYPVVLFLFMRPENTHTLLTLIADVGVNKVYIFADGPRNLDDEKLTKQVQAVVRKFAKTHPKIEFINTFSTTNLGLKKNIVQGLSKVFSKEDAAIILEDDCMPSPDFFTFTSEMLHLYKSNQKVLSISGTGVRVNDKYSYDFSKYQLCWGWATWARAWKLYDLTLSSYNEQSNPSLINQNWQNPILRWYWKHVFRKVKLGIISTWDYQWTYAHIANQGLAVIPSFNLVKNTGFDAVATHTKVGLSSANMNLETLDFPLIHPQKVAENSRLTKSIEKIFYSHPLVLLGMLRYIIKSSILHKS